MSKRIIFLNEFNCLAEEHTIIGQVTNVELFLKLLTKEHLELLLETQIQEENYELAGEITKKLKTI